MFGGIFGKIFSHAVFASIGGGLKAGAHWLGGLNVYQLGCIALAIVALWQHMAGVVAREHGRKADAQVTAMAGQLDDANKALAQSRANETLLQGQIDDTNKKVTGLANESARQQQTYQDARKRASGRVGAAQAASQRYKEQSRQKPPAGQPTEPLDKDHWP